MHTYIYIYISAGHVAAGQASGLAAGRAAAGGLAAAGGHSVNNDMCILRVVKAYKLVCIAYYILEHPIASCRPRR